MTSRTQQSPGSNSRASKFLSRFAASQNSSSTTSHRHTTPRSSTTPTLATEHNRSNTSFSKEYWDLHLQLEQATEQNQLLQKTSEEELFHAQCRVEEANEAKNKMKQQTNERLRQATAHSQELNDRLENERTKVQQLLQETKKLEESMVEKKQQLMAQVQFQEQRAEDIQQSGLRLQELAEKTLKDAGEQNAEANRQVSAMKRSLQLVNGYKLHTILEQVTQQSAAQENKLKRMISHLQADRMNLVSNLVHMKEERDMFKEHLRAVLSEPATARNVVHVEKGPTTRHNNTSVPASNVAVNQPSTTNPRSIRQENKEIMTPIRSEITGDILAVKITTVAPENVLKTIRSVNGEILAVRIQ